VSKQQPNTTDPVAATPSAPYQPEPTAMKQCPHIGQAYHNPTHCRNTPVQ